MGIAENLRTIRKRIAEAAEHSGRTAGEIKLVASTKDVPAELILQAIREGVTDIGENRVQEASGKFDQLSGQPVTWHMIGHLQTNKVKAALQVFSVIQSVDSERLAREISAKAGRVTDVMLEVNTSGEASKFGVAPEAAASLAGLISTLPNIKLTGLMTIGPLSDDESKVRQSFRTLKKLFNDIKELNLPAHELKYLSMGMSDDYETAIEEGSSLVRIGRAIFGIEHNKGR